MQFGSLQFLLHAWPAGALTPSKEGGTRQLFVQQITALIL